MRKRIIRKIYNIGKRGIVLISSLFPMCNCIVVESFLGKRNDDNLEYLLLKYKDEYKIYYVQSGRCSAENTIGIPIFKNTVKYIWLMHTSRIIVTNSRLHFGVIKKRKKQVIIQMWHGIPWKKLVYDQDKINFSDQREDSYLEKFSEDVKKWDYLWIPDEYAKNKLTAAFKFTGKYIEDMYPADIKMLQLKTDFEYIYKIKSLFGIEEKKKIILYMPTFRENQMSAHGGYEFVKTMDIEAFMRDKVGYVLLVRGHYLVSGSMMEYAGKIIDVTEYQSVMNLYLISDVLITDYSSVIYSFSLLEKPIISIQFDKEAYMDTRGLYADGITDMNIIEVDTVKQLHDLNLEKLSASIPKKDFYKNDLKAIDEIIRDVLSTE